MEVLETRNVLEALSSYGPKGCGVLSLSNNTGIAPSKLKSLFFDNPEFFCKLSETENYTINKFSHFKGSIPLMVEEAQNKLDKEAERNLRKKHGFGITICLLLLSVVSVIVLK